MLLSQNGARHTNNAKHVMENKTAQGSTIPVDYFSGGLFLGVFFFCFLF